MMGRSINPIRGWFSMFMCLIFLWTLSSRTVVGSHGCSAAINVYGGYQYIIYNTGRTFSATRAHCQSLGGDMAVITSADQNNFITSKLDWNGNYYIGLEDMDMDGVYKSIDGTGIRYVNWEDRLSENAKKKLIDEPYCAVIASGRNFNDRIRGRWKTVACESQRRHICQIPLDVQCNSQDSGESQYLIVSVPATPRTARTSCQGYGGDLALIKTDQVNRIIKDFIHRSNGEARYHYFGLRKNSVRKFTWLDNTALDEYNDWYQEREPNLPVGSWAYYLTYDYPGGQRLSAWYAVPSQDTTFPYICERTRGFKNTSAFGGIDYFISPSWMTLSFSDASTYCQYHGGDLALIKSRDVNTFLHGLITGLQTNVFFGLTRKSNRDNFTWIDGTNLQYSSFGSPGRNTWDNCAALQHSDSNMGWLSTLCSEKQHFICERYHDMPEYKWSKLGGTLYHISQSSKTSYSFARKFCQEQGGDLAQPKTEQINNHLIHLAKGNSFWFGLNINTGEREFEWISGTRINEFPSWSNYSFNRHFDNERCVHQQVRNGWRKLPCTSYLRFACEKPSRPRPVPPIRLIAATATPYEGGGRNPSYLCLLGSKDEDILELSTRRLVRLTEDINPESYRAPGYARNVSSHSHVGLRQTLPPSNDLGFGFFECSSVTASRKTTVPLGILPSTRQLQPMNGSLTRTVQVGDNVTLSVINVHTRIEDDSGIEWKKLSDEGMAYSVIERSSNQLSHTIQSAVTSDAGVYVTYRNGMLQQRRFSFIRLIVRECPPGRWNPPSCDRLCDYCYNGGICHESSGTCICPPGHAGKNCLQACGRHKFGWDCELECGRGQLLDKCAGSQICLPDPYGCNCLAGYTGIYCNETCSLLGRFGSDCLQKCHCLNGADCDHATGECPSHSGCSNDWSGPACQVPTVCPTGYFGSNCTQKCNCRNETACHKDTGYCYEVEGHCDVGYVKDSVHLPSSCTTFSGCYRSCSKTCHCSGGIEDCNFLTGNCNSSTCHPRWMGDQCQTDRFHVRSEKTNPGVANFSCSYTKSSRTKYVKAAVGTLNGDHLINRTTSISTRRFITSYFYKSIGREKPIYCFVGDPENSSGFAFIRLPPRDFYALPNYTGKPKLIVAGYYHAVVSWRQWNPQIDTGDGPVVGYKIYVRLGNNDEEVQPPGVGLPDSPVRVLSRRSTDNATEMVTYNVTELEAGSTYAIQIAAIRDGIKGEGESGPMLTVTTESLPVTSTVSSTSHVSTTNTIAADDDHDESRDGEPGGQISSSMTTVAGGVVGIIIGILIIIIVIILFKHRRKVNLSKAVNEEQEMSIDFEDTALDGGCSGQETISTQNKPTPRNIGTKPAIATKPCRRELTDATHRAQEPADDQSGTKPLKRQPIPTSQFPAFVSTNRYTSLFSDEFHDLPEADIYPQTVAQQEINHRKNRYKNILPYDSARVKLRVINDDPNSDYFNASYIPSFENDKAYIASQGPNNASVDDFWRMVWQEKVTNIAMVTKLKEGDKIKCAQYWPNKPGDSKVFGNVKVEFVSQNPCTGGVKREMTMKMGKDKRTITQFHFRVWPDKGVPKHTSLLLKFIKEVKANQGHNPHPLVIHCSAGVGRTGVVISIDSIAEHAKRTRMVDVFSFVTKIRQNRPFMVQTQEQYAFIYGAVLEDLLWRNTYVPIIHFSDHLKDLRSVDEGGKSKMTKEFETLMTLCPDPPASQTRSGRAPENHHKNRYGNNLPLQRNRVILDSPDNDYINASCVRGAHCTFITTQMPMPSTVSDFCCMVLTRQPSSIVMLNDKDQDDKSCAQYWSDDGIAELGSYKVSILSTSENDDMTIRQLKITKNSKSCHTVTQYQFLGWQKHGSTEKSRALSFLKLVSAVKSALKNKSEFSVLVHCLSGVGRTGAFCSVMECIAHMEESDSVDIFQTVKILRADRMQFVQTEEDYAFIYDVIRAYLHQKNYEQLPYPVEDHTYGNLDTDDYCTPDPEENPYEVTDSQAAGASGLVYGNVETERAKQSQRPTPTNSQTLYENFEFEY